MDVSSETKLKQQLTFSYKSFDGSSQFADGSSPSDFTCDFNKNHDLSHLPEEIPLNQLASGSPNVLDQSLCDLKETEKGFTNQGALLPVYIVSITLAVGVTIALILHIYLGESLVPVKGLLVSDHKRCTALGQRVLHDHGSSVDAAITAALCLGVVHPHASGVGGGGIMLVHDIPKNETRVINFQGIAPEGLKDEMLQNVSELKAGLYVGVPGMLRGLQLAHSLYGSLSWEDVITRAALVAKEGFNVSVSLGEAISKVRGEQLSQRFRDLFLPDGQALHPGSFLRMPSLAQVLEADVSNFYAGNLSQEMQDEVQANGGVLSRHDISNYSVQVDQPVESLFNEFIIQVPPSAGPALISALRLLEGFHLNDNNSTENVTRHRIAEALKAVLAMASGLGDPKYNSDMLSESQTEVHRKRIDNSTIQSLQMELMAGRVAVMGPDDLMVSVASSLSRPFGSRIITRSGVILNSVILDFFWPNKTQGFLPNQKNRVQPGKRPLSSLMPTIMVPAWHRCGIYMVLSSSGGQQSLSVITQALITALSLYKEKNDSISVRGTHPQLEPNRPLADSEFPEESVLFQYEKDHKVQGVKTNIAVPAILKNKDTVTAMTLP